MVPVKGKTVKRLNPKEDCFVFTLVLSWLCVAEKSVKWLILLNVSKYTLIYLIHFNINYVFFIKFARCYQGMTRKVRNIDFWSFFRRGFLILFILAFLAQPASSSVVMTQPGRKRKQGNFNDLFSSIITWFFLFLQKWKCGLIPKWIILVSRQKYFVTGHAKLHSKGSSSKGRCSMKK